MYDGAGDGASAAAARWRRVRPRLRAAGWHPRPRPPSPDYYELARQQFKEYLENACVHGLKYIGRSDQPTYVRVLWAFLVLACLIGLVTMTHIMSRNFYPIKITVVDTRVDVRDYPFPSVTVCPVANIQKSVALASLRLYYKIDRRRGGRGPVPPNASAQEDVDLAALERLHVRALRTLQDFRFPLYSSKWTGLDVEPLESLGTMDPRELLLMALPTCQQLFIYCTWNNKVSDCCDLFEVQETNAGLCYAFNSCTSMTAKTDRCHPRSGEPEETRAMYVSTVKAEPSEVLSEDPHARGIVVVIANPYEFPVPSNGYYFPEDGSINMLTTTVTVQDADDDIRPFPWAVRECKFRDEGPLEIARPYTQATCVESCRLRIAAGRCHCLPFHFSVMPTSKLAELPRCNASGLYCVFAQRDLLRNLFITSKLRRNYGWERLTSEQETGSCECPPECDLLLYNSDEFSYGAGQNASSGFLSSGVFVRQKNAQGANIRYMKASSVSFSEYLSTLGNLASLFLGVSLLSVLEFLWVSVSCLRTLSMRWCSTHNQRS